MILLVYCPIRPMQVWVVRRNTGRLHMPIDAHPTRLSFKRNSIVKIVYISTGICSSVTSRSWRALCQPLLYGPWPQTKRQASRPRSPISPLTPEISPCGMFNYRSAIHGPFYIMLWVKSGCLGLTVILAMQFCKNK